ncbi:MAG: DUF1844 domain-containing protein [Acidobacteria bacterium]|jgi:hypothetical protein|nr:DUF1844 domain-containing protein [Acidobacteriota bacterium]MBA4121192.1 DUF1844 domain-containing protein [Acidobacteriota bacterium]
MIGKEQLNNEEQPEVKVTDKRKFNVDGSLREGITIEAEKPKEEMPINPPEETEQTQAEETEAQEFDDSDIPGVDDPASFVNFLTTLATQAAAALGAMPHPATGQRTLDLETGKYWIDVLAMLKEKTRNNLHSKEAEIFDGMLSDLQMQYVQVQRIAEEKLKQKAAQKFSANDILGKK